MATNCTDSNCTSPTPSSPPFVAVVVWISSTSIGTISVFLNAITIAVIRKNPQLRSPCFKLICGCAFGELLLGLTSYIGTNVARLGELQGHWSLSNHYRATCLLIFAGSMFFFPFCALTVTLVSMDRMCGTLAPIQYRKLGKRGANIGLSICAFLAGLEFIVLTFAEGPLDQLTTCTFAGTVGRRPFLVFNGINMGLNIVCVVCYLAMFISAYAQRWKMKARVHGGFNTAADQDRFLKQQALIMPAAQMLAVLYVITAAIPNIALNFVTYNSVLYYVSFTVQALATLVEFVSLTVRCKHFREFLGQMFTFNGTYVTEMVGSNGNRNE